ncbi:MAG: alcohol dehydrogenase catalytic domain-containing protein [Dehalococcoidia bacterium]|nr:alcohol dehydrogenase catalytic domain-containing protein [Dehalococcoidia bacterium]
MKAAVLWEQQQALKIEEVDHRQPGPGEVLVRTVASGVCHSDLHMIDGLWPARLPMILGHEAAGVVEKVGSGVSHVKPGDHVVANFRPFCGRCGFCVSGRPYLCDNQEAADPGAAEDRVTLDGRRVEIFTSVGSFAEYMLVPETGVLRVRQDAPLEKVCLVGCAVMTGIGAVTNTAKVGAGARVAVIGAGGIGLNIIQGARLVGASQIIAVDLLDSKLELARQFGATHTVNAANDDAVARVQEISGRQLDFAFESIGRPQSATDAFRMIAFGGTVVIVGMMPLKSEITLPGFAFLFEKKVIGCMYGSARVGIDMPRLIDLYMDGRLMVDELVSREWELEGINDAFSLLRSGEVARSIIRYG